MPREYLQWKLDKIDRMDKNDERVRAVYMEGSRVNKNAPKDMFQDYDIVYVVKETKSFIDNKNWINIFGKILFMQYREVMQ